MEKEIKLTHEQEFILRQAIYNRYRDRKDAAYKQRKCEDEFDLAKIFDKEAEEAKELWHLLIGAYEIKIVKL